LETPTTEAARPADAAFRRASLERLIGLAVFGERVAAKIYAVMARLSSDHAAILRRFAAMEGQHSAWFVEAAQANGIEPDREFADRELGYLLEQVERYEAERSVESLAVLQGFIVESLAIATYEPFLSIADRYPGTRDAFARALEEERYHVEWVTRYLRLRFFDAEAEFLALAEKVNIQGIDCIGGTMMNIADHLDAIGLSGADCAGAMMDGYAALLERVGIERRLAAKSVVGLFMPLIHKYRRGERAK
jgi:rubrerythrin